MKKLLCALLAILLIVSSIFIMASCNKTNEDPDDKQNETPEYKLPEGYAWFGDDRISFAYPEAWTKTEGSITILKDDTTGNNITFVYEAANAVYSTLTAESFETQMKPVYEASGLSISDVSVVQRKNSTMDITQISFNTIISSASMKQTQLIATVGDRSYVITVTELVDDEALVEEVFNSIKAAE